MFTLAILGWRGWGSRKEDQERGKSFVVATVTKQKVTLGLNTHRVFMKADVIYLIPAQRLNVTTPEVWPQKVFCVIGSSRKTFGSFTVTLTCHFLTFVF